jgi:hypothetical protein
MSDGAKRARDEAERDDVVVISNFGDEHPEMLADWLATMCMRKDTNVTSYVYVPNFANEPIFLANCDDCEFDTGRGKYVQKMIPNTKCLEDIAADVTILFCHGGQRRRHMAGENDFHLPSYVCFSEPKGVDIGGVPLKVSPFTSRIFSCLSYTDGDQTFTMPAQGVSLSQVTHDSELVLLLCCHGHHFMTEYASDHSCTVKPDFVVFLKEGGVLNTSISIFIVLLTQAIAWFTRAEAVNKPRSWHELIRRSVCQVMLWVKQEGTDHAGGAEQFYTFLALHRCIYAFKNSYKIDGNPTVFTVDAQEKCELLQDLQSVTLMLWSGSIATRSTTKARVVPGYDVIDHNDTVEDLENWMKGTNPLPVSSERLFSRKKRLSVDALMLQLQALAHGV